MPVKSYLERKTAEKSNPESNPEYYRGRMGSPGQRKEQNNTCKKELWEGLKETKYTGLKNDFIYINDPMEPTKIIYWFK